MHQYPELKPTQNQAKYPGDIVFNFPTHKMSLFLTDIKHLKISDLHIDFQLPVALTDSIHTKV